MEETSLQPIWTIRFTSVMEKFSCVVLALVDRVSCFMA
jgi:hypothetical protein